MDTIFRCAKMLREGKLSSVELTRLYIEEIKKSDLNAYTSYNFEAALLQAENADKLIASGEGSPLCGVPMTLKDNISAKGILTTCASKILSGYKPFYNATAWKRLEQKGAVMLGKTNMDEFAMGSTCETSCYGATLNPRDKTKVPGGSSGGGASAVCGNLAAYALGSDTGGSIRQPASFCGIVGLKPTYGAVSRYGLVAFASSLDQIGPLAGSVLDAACVFDAIKGEDPQDGTSAKIDMSPIATDSLGQSVRGLKIGYVKEYFEGLNDEIRLPVERAINLLKENGAEVVEVSVPDMKLSLPAYYILACAEAASNLGRYDGIRYGYRAEKYSSVDEMILSTRSSGFGAEVKRRIMLGSYVLSSGYYDAYYKKARSVRAKITEEFNNAFANCNVIIAPTTTSTAFPLNNAAKSVTDVYLSDLYTVPVNIAGLPSVSVPCGVGADGMPVGAQFIGGKFSERAILNAARFFELNADTGLSEYKGGVKL